MVAKKNPFRWRLRWKTKNLPSLTAACKGEIMINSFQPLNTITSGLILQQLEQEVIANNLAQPSVDSNGYLMNSLEQVNSVSNSPINITGSNGLLSVGTGASAESITRLRSSFLDNQIQQESMVVGYNEILSNSTGTNSGTGIMNQINSIVNPTGPGAVTLSNTLSKFTTAWTTLAANPTNMSDQTAVINAGVTFADTANSQYSQLQNLQLDMNGQVSQTVSQINNLLQQLGSVNQQLMTTGGSNQNSLLDARDYALDLLSRLTNYQVSYGTNGTANVWLGGVSLVNGTNVSLLQENTENPNNPSLVDITVGTYSSQVTGNATSTPYDLTSSITGGNLGGELYGRNVLLQNYKIQVDQIATSVLNITNNIYEAGYVANTANTGTAFFTGTGASNIEVNAVLANDAATAASPFLATEVDANSATGQLAGFLGNLGTLLATSSVQSTSNININGGPPVNPALPLNTQFGALATLPLGGSLVTSGSFTINGVVITYSNNGVANPNDSINDILNEINSSVPGVYAVFNSTTQEFYMYSSGNITIQDALPDNFLAWSKVKNVLTSTISMNNSFAPTEPEIIPTNPLDSNVSGGLVGDTPQGPNTQAYFVTPSIGGTFTLNGTQVNWTDSQPLTGPNSIKTAITTAVPGVTVSFTANGNNTAQQLQLFSTSPLSIYDDSGNFTVFTGLNGNLSISSLASNVLSNASTQNSSLTTSYASSSASLTQLNNCLFYTSDA